MWTKTIIVDKSVKIIKTVNQTEIAARTFSYGFVGFKADGTSDWTKLAEHIKLYDSVADAVTDAKKLREEGPVDVITFNIAPELGQVQLVTVKF